MFCNKDANKQIDCTHKRALQVLYKDYESSFEALLARIGSNSVHVNSGSHIAVTACTNSK